MGRNAPAAPASGWSMQSPAGQRSRAAPTAQPPLPPPIHASRPAHADCPRQLCQAPCLGSLGGLPRWRGPSLPCLPPRTRVRSVQGQNQSASPSRAASSTPGWRRATAGRGRRLRASWCNLLLAACAHGQATRCARTDPLMNCVQRAAQAGCRPNQAASSRVQAAASRTRVPNAASTRANLCNMRSDLHALALMQPKPLEAVAEVCGGSCRGMPAKPPARAAGWKHAKACWRAAVSRCAERL